MALSDTTIRNAKPKDKLYKLTDRDGLTLLIKPNGSRRWKLRYVFNKKENTLALGDYPAVSLKSARDRQAEAHKLLAAGLDPNAEKRRKLEEDKITSTNTFKAISALRLTIHANLNCTSNKLKIFVSTPNQIAIPRYLKSRLLCVI